MVFRRRRAVPRRPQNPRNYARRKAMRRGRAKGFGLRRSFSYKQNVDGLSINGIGARFINQTAATQHLAMEFRAQDVPNWAAFSSLYDQYCISKIVIKLIPGITNNVTLPLAASSAVNPGITGTVVDMDDAIPLGNLQQYEQYESFKQMGAMSGKTITRVITPASRTYMVQAGGASVPAGIVQKKWYDCSYGAISHCGLKWYIDQYYNVSCPQSWQVFATYYIKFRNVR